MNQFDEKAKDWDEKPQRVALGQAIARAVAAHLAPGQPLRLLDYGCGTGLCSLPLADRCSRLLGVDSSAGMLAQFEAKARAARFEHVSTRRLDLTAEALTGMEFDAILCAMTFHHVREVGLLLQRFHSLLSAGGLMAVADLDEEDGSFHQDSTGVEHHGFRREWMRERLHDAGFSRVEFVTAHEIERAEASGEIRKYPVFLATAWKRR
jgi:cyclopropane fatty-acyl-phospholipid synthase-like methyltransferase